MDAYYPAGISVQDGTYPGGATILAEDVYPGDTVVFLTDDWTFQFPYIIQIDSGGGRSVTYPLGIHTITTDTGAQIDSSTWGSLDSVAVTETLNGQNIYYAVSFDNDETFKIWDPSASAWRDIAYYDGMTWHYDSAPSGSTS